MTDREKVIKGLELCSREKGQTIGCLLDCPYDDEEGCRRKVMRDALALLKVQEPRVLTLEEAVIAELVYYEPRYVNHGVTNGLFPVIRKVDRFCDRVEWYSPYFPDGKVHCLFTPDEYGVFSRCWTSRPTDAQREAEPWQ